LIGEQDKRCNDTISPGSQRKFKCCDGLVCNEKTGECHPHNTPPVAQCPKTTYSCQYDEECMELAGHEGCNMCNKETNFCESS
jgi:hypothetical protein